MEKTIQLSALRQLPAVEQLLQTASAGKLSEHYGRTLTVKAIRSTLESARQNYILGGAIPDQETLLQQMASLLQQWTMSSLTPVINATGVILHTNLGRAPLSRAALDALQAASLGYSNLEFDLEKGQRGSRSTHAEALLCRLTGAEAALVVNNNAAAVLLALSALAKRRTVVISRTQMVEIGGGFRVPDVMKQSGARLAEIGTTNRVNLSDYEQVVQDENPALILWAHRSNFRIIGFTEEPALADIAAVAHRAGILLIDDLGSGALLNTENFGLVHEPTVAESLQAGADLICFSGDKLLGGPQAGIIIGKAHLIAKLQKHPLARAVRADKLCLAALSATLIHYLKDNAEREIPIWRMISTPLAAIRARAEQWAAILGQGRVQPGFSTIGGGSLPEETLATFTLSISTRNPQKFLESLRRSRPPVIGRLDHDFVLFDPRTVLPEQDEAILTALMNLLSETDSPMPGKARKK